MALSVSAEKKTKAQLGEEWVNKQTNINKQRVHSSTNWGNSPNYEDESDTK